MKKSRYDLNMTSYWSNTGTLWALARVYIDKGNISLHWGSKLYSITSFWNWNICKRTTKIRENKRINNDKLHPSKVARQKSSARKIVWIHKWLVWCRKQKANDLFPKSSSICYRMMTAEETHFLLLKGIAVLYFISLKICRW